MSKVFLLMKNYIPIPNVLKQRENEEFLILANKDSNIYYLNDMAKTMWLLIDGKISIKDIYEKINNEYDVTSEELQNDIIDFIRDLQWKRLISLKEV